MKTVAFSVDLEIVIRGYSFFFFFLKTRIEAKLN